jgi:PTH1 family peptidyl-tRNA hydrolase
VAGQFVIIGLGNPGPKYDQTRHNAGFWFLDRLAEQASASFRARNKLHADVSQSVIDGHDCVLVKPQTYMNESGRAVRAVADYYKADASRLLVAYDELDLAPGDIRLKLGGGHGGHNGLRDVFRHIEDHEFLRLRIGIGHPGMRDLVTPYVLSRAPADQEGAIRDSIGKAAAVMPDILAGENARATKNLHTRN